MKTLDYSVGSVLLKNVAITNKCQSCGQPSESTRCSACTTYSPKSVDSMYKTVTVSGPKVYVNGQLVKTEATSALALRTKGLLESKYAVHNFKVKKFGFV